jgi:exonuclease SbcC
MKIFLQSLKLTNFKGIRELVATFNQVTNISGQNATGKTTLMDGLLVVIFRKRLSTDRKDFEIKTLDENNKPYQRLDHEVEGVLIVDGNELTLRRCYKEKWTKKRGSADHEFTGHETSYFWNDVPLQQKEYEQKIASLLNENIFKLITNTTYFNSLKWQDRRAVLMQIAGKIDDTEVLDRIATVNNKAEVLQITNALNQGKTIDEFKDQLAAKRKKLKDELAQLPSRIDEANRSLPEDKNYKEIEILISDALTNLETTESLLMNKTSAQKEHQQKISEKISEVQKLTTQLQQIEFNEKNAAADKKRNREQVLIDKRNDLRTKQQDLNRLLTQYDVEEKRKKENEDWANNLRKEWETVNAETLVFKDNEFSCPACKRAYEASNIEEKKSELTSNFNKSKSERLASITARGTKIASDIKVIAAELENIKTKGSVLRAEIATLESDICVLEEQHQHLSANESQEVISAIASNTEYQGIKEMITLRTEEINTPFSKDDNTELLNRKKELNAHVTDLRSQLATKDQREKQLARIKELTDQEGTMAQELASLEGVEFCIEQFTKAKMDTLESRINGRFEVVRFKMFEDQINGGQTEACTTLINGVPYADANTAAKIQAGLDIINTLSAHYDMQAPVWVDNRESVITLPETNCQLINLIVSSADKKLRISSESRVMEAVA